MAPSQPAMRKRMELRSFTLGILACLMKVGSGRLRDRLAIVASAKKLALQLPVSRENFNRWASHIHVSRLVPLELEVSAGEMGQELAGSSIREHTRYAHRAYAGAAGQCDSAAALPGAHRRLAR